MSTAQEGKLMALKSQVEKLQGQKDTLLKELDEVEMRYEKPAFSINDISQLLLIR